LEGEEVEFEIVEVYMLDGQKRFRLRVKGTNIVVNVAAETPDEAGEKAASLLEKSRIAEILRKSGGH